MSKSNVTYKHVGTGRVVTHSQPHQSLERAAGWERVEDLQPATVEAILAEVDDDPEKAAAALEVEKAGKGRTTLVAKLEAIIGASA